MTDESIKQEDILVTVICRTYNHERFIGQALEGFVSQKTTFLFEVLVHDDASTDSTADIIRKYEDKYPSIIKPIYQTENQHSKHKAVVSSIMLPRARGKYLAWCEGDDFWTDSNKLQEQVDALENHPDCVACFCNVSFVNYDGNVVSGTVSNLKQEGIINSDTFVRQCLYSGQNKTLSFQISGFVIRKEVYFDYVKNPPEYQYYFRKIRVGDIPLFLYCGLQGNVYYIKKVMSCYRTGNKDSAIGTMKSDLSKTINHFSMEKQAYIAFDEYTNKRYHNEATKGANLREFRILLATHNIYGMHAPEMKEFYSQLSLLQKVKENVFHFIPKLEPVWNHYKVIKSEMLWRVRKLTVSQLRIKTRWS